MNREEYLNLNVAQLDELIEQLRQQQKEITQHYVDLARSEGKLYQDYKHIARAERSELRKLYVKYHLRRTFLANKKPKDYTNTDAYKWFGKQHKDLNKQEYNEYCRRVTARRRAKAKENDTKQ